MTKYLYLEGSCGISGDMTVAALLDLGGNRQKLDAVLQSLPLEGYDYVISRKNSYSIAGCDFAVRLHDTTPMQESAYMPEHHHEHEHAHYHEHEHEHDHHHEHRHLKDVYEIIDRGTMTENAKNLAKKIFHIVAEAEAKAHGCGIEEVHFHEVGAVDSIIDIVSAAVLLDDLDIKDVIVTGLNEGEGFVMCQHGQLPIPVPAVANIASAHGIALRAGHAKSEMVTPTGIAIAAAVKTSDRLPDNYKILKIGVGLGKRDFGRANFLRAMILENAACPNNESEAEKIYVAECNIDDSTPEEMGLAMEKLFAAGAKDVHFETCYMKKNRPAYILRVVAAAADLTRIEDAIFRHTSTIGLRKYVVERTCMAREIVSVFIREQEVKVKKCAYKDIVRYYPEYESIKALSDTTGEPFRELYQQACRLAAEEK